MVGDVAEWQIEHLRGCWSMGWRGKSKDGSWNPHELDHELHQGVYGLLGAGFIDFARTCILCDLFCTTSFSHYPYSLNLFDLSLSFSARNCVA